MKSKSKNFMAGMESGGLLEFAGDNPPDITALKAAVANKTLNSAEQEGIARNFSHASTGGFSQNPKDEGPTQSVSVSGGAAMTSIIKG